MYEYYNKHYIRTDEQSNITDRWSDGPHPDRDTAGAFCINEQGGYQLRLFPGGEENPQLMNDNGVYLYKYINGAVVAKTPEEIEAETPVPGELPVDPITQIQIALTELYEEVLSRG